MAVIELVEELEVAATTAPAKKSARKAAARQDKVEALAREDEAPAAAAEPDQDAEAPENASGDKGAEGPGDQAEGEDTKA
jgi:large subunit ribosomal protein L17